VAVATAWELLAETVLSSFCLDVDASTVALAAYVSGGKDSLGYAIGSYYVTGEGTNPLLHELARAKQNVAEVDASTKQLGSLLSSLCPHWDKLENVTGCLRLARESLFEAGELLTVEHVYPYYDEVVRKAACDTTAEGLGWLVLCQAFVAVVCLPLLTLATLQYLRSRQAWGAALASRWQQPGIELHAARY